MKGPIQGSIHRQRSRCLVVEYLEDRLVLSAGAFGTFPGGPIPREHFSSPEMAAGGSSPGTPGQFRQAPQDSQPTTGGLPPVDGINNSMPASSTPPSDQHSGANFTNTSAVNCAPATPVFVPAPPVVLLLPGGVRPPTGPGDRPPRAPIDNTSAANRNLATELIAFVNTITSRLRNSSTSVARGPLVSQSQPTSPSILHTVTRVATLLDNSASSQGAEEATSALTVLQVGEAEQAADEGLTPARPEEVTGKEPAAQPGPAPNRDLVVQGETVANPLNLAAMRVRAGHRERPSWADFSERPAETVRPVGPTMPAAARDKPSHPPTAAAKRLAPPLSDLVEIVSLSSKAAVALETGLPLDLLLLRQEVDTFFAHLASHPEAGERFQSYLRFAPWLALLGGAAAFEFARRWDKKSSRRTASEDEAVFGPVAFLPEDRQ
jgi:hypothetical protein